MKPQATRNEHTSKRVASLAARLLRALEKFPVTDDALVLFKGRNIAVVKFTCGELKSLAASALTQARSKRG
jgi:hypothetical protein